jgi:hypothetical protein
LNYTQVFQKLQNERYPDMMNPYDLIGNFGALKHIETAIKRSLENMDMESLQYAIKIIINLLVSHEIIFIAGEVKIIDLLCFVIQNLKNGVKAANEDLKVKKYSKLIINDTLKAIKLISTN